MLKNKLKSKLETTNDFFTLSAMGFVIVISTGIGVFIGYKIDEFFHTLPIFSILFLVYSLISVFYYIRKIVLKKEKKQ